MSLLPCSTCPWRVDQRASSIPGYVHAKACRLINTVGEGDGFRKIMACHGSTEDEPRVCNGYLARAGWTNLNVRILASKGKLPSPNEVIRACEEHGVELHDDYPAVLAKLETTQWD